VTINGTNFISPSAVRFNGLDATFVVVNTTRIDATVPAGVTTGPLSVITPYGSATSAGSFSPPSYSVSGQIVGAGNVPLQGVTVTFDMNSSGTMTQSSAVTDANGNYSSGNVGCQNSVVVTPFRVGFGFTPDARAFTSSNCLSGTASANFSAAQAGANSFRFSQSSYSVTEGAGGLTTTVTRSGDTSGSATVAVTTTDTDTFMFACSDRVNNAGGAFGRCDYSTTVDTVVFLAGETSKNVVIPIIDDSFMESSETFGLLLSSPAGGTLGAPATSTVTITDNDLVDGSNPILTSPFFVRLQYLDFLSREPDPAGFNAWVGVLDGCSDLNNNPACDRILVSSSFFGSIEFQLKGYFVYRFYKLAFNRLPTYAEVVVDMRAVTGTTPNETFQKKAAFTNAFVQRTEFINQYNAMSSLQYVSALIGRYSLNQITTPDPAAPNGTNKVTLTTADLTNQLTAGTLTRAQVLRAIADSDEVYNLEYNQAFVAMQYYGYLRRTPETAGYNNWLNYLNTHPGDFRTMVNGFVNSNEYRLRFGP
jgi:hypothetical protein